MDWKLKLAQLYVAAKEFCNAVGFEYDFDEDEYHTQIKEVENELSRDTFSSIDELVADLDYYFGKE